jgi:hypothetical protein
MGRTFREDAAIRFWAADRTTDGAGFASDAVDDAQTLALACCNAWGHAWEITKEFATVCNRCGEVKS